MTEPEIALRLTRSEAEILNAALIVADPYAGERYDGVPCTPNSHRGGEGCSCRGPWQYCQNRDINLANSRLLRSIWQCCQRRRG